MLGYDLDQSEGLDGRNSYDEVSERSDVWHIFAIPGISSEARLPF